MTWSATFIENIGAFCKGYIKSSEKAKTKLNIIQNIFFFFWGGGGWDTRIHRASCISHIKFSSMNFFKFY